MSPNYFASCRAIIFDVDGVLVDSEYMSCNALNIVFAREFGVDIGRDYSAVIGKSLPDSLSHYLNLYDLQGDLQHLCQQKEQAYRDQADGVLHTFPYCERFIQVVKPHYRLGVASSGSPEKINFSLSQVNFLQYFDHVTSGSDVVHGKPAPDIFLLAAHRAGVSPHECLVIEDSLLGAAGALAAGCKVYGFSGAYSAVDFQRIGVPFVQDYAVLLQIYSRGISKDSSYTM